MHTQARSIGMILLRARKGSLHWILGSNARLYFTFVCYVLFGTSTFFDENVSYLG